MWALQLLLQPAHVWVQAVGITGTQHNLHSDKTYT